MAIAIDYTDDEHAVLRDLGQAFAELWDRLPEAVREDVRHRAVTNGPDMQGIKEEIDAVIEKTLKGRDS